MSRLFPLALCAVAVGLLSVNLAGCGVSRGPRVRVSTATAEELKAVDGEPVVWYEFRKGDIVPFGQLFYGVAEGLPERPMHVRATRDFWLVFRQNGPVALSLDNKSLVWGGQSTGRTILMVTKNQDGRGGQVNWMTYMGESRDAEGELQKLFERVNKQAP